MSESECAIKRKIETSYFDMRLNIFLYIKLVSSFIPLFAFNIELLDSLWKHMMCRTIVSL